MKFKFKKFIFTTPVLISLLFLTGQGCTKGPSTEELASVRPVTLNYWTVYNDVDELRRMAAEYKATKPYVTIDIRQVRYEEFDKLFVNALADDVSPDIVSSHVRWLSKYKNRLSPMPSNIQVSNIFVKETVVETQKYTMPSVPAIKSNFVGTVVDDVVLDDKIYGLPLALDTLAIYYNVDLLDQSGVALAPSTWSEFQEAVKKSTKFDASGNIIQSGVALGTADNVDNMFDILSLLILQNGVGMVEDSRVAFTEGLKQSGYGHPTMEALRFYTDFAQPAKDVYSWNEKMGNSLDAFARGKSVFYLGFAYDRDRIKARAPQLEFEIIPVPQLNEGAPSNIANYWVESVVAKSESQDLAWDFIRFITTQENIEKYTSATLLPTPLRTQISVQLENEEIYPFTSQVLHAENWYRGNNMEAAFSAFGEMVSAFLEAPGDDTNTLKRDIAIVERAAQVIQQTL